MLKLLSKNEQWHCDGTFVSSPKLYKQTYIIHSFYKDECYPCIYINIKNKDEAIYEKCLNIIVKLAKENYNIELKPKLFFGDFEEAAIKAFKQVFPGIVFTGCFFHFVQAIWRNIMKLGLWLEYTDANDKTIFKWLQLFKGLAFLPLDRINDGLAFIQNIQPNNEKCSQFLKYFISTWGNNNSKFPPLMWNHWDSYSKRTNNPLEGFNLGLNLDFRIFFLKI